MLPSEIVTDVRRIFGDESGLQISDADCIRWINDAQLDIVRRTACLSTLFNPNTIIGTPDYILPADFFKFQSVSFDGVLLHPTTRQEMNQLAPGRGQAPIERGVPTRFFRAGNVLSIWPAPDSIKILSVNYVRRPALIVALSDVLEIPVEMHHNIKDRVLARAYEMDDQLDSADSRENKFRRMTEELKDDFNHPFNDTYPSVREVDYG